MSGIIIIGACLSASSFAFADDAANNTYPKRKPGLWEIQTSGAEALPPQTMKQCIDAETDMKLMKMGTDMSAKMGGACAKNTFTKQGSQYIGEAECTMMGTKMTTKSVMSGDFESAYTGESTASFDPPMKGMKETKTKISARWVGACEAGQKPGDMFLSNGMKMNIDDLANIGAMGGGMGSSRGAMGGR